MTKNEFDKMLKATILEDRYQYNILLLSELEKIIPSYKEVINIFARSKRDELLKKIKNLGVPTLCYASLQQEKPNIQQTLNDEFWEQRRFDLAKNLLMGIWNTEAYDKNSDQYKIIDAIRAADKFIEYFKKKEI